MFLGQPGLGYLIVAGSDVVNTALIFASLMIASLVIVIVTLSLSYRYRDRIRTRGGYATGPTREIHAFLA